MPLIALVPLGETSRSIVELLAPVVASTFRREVVLAPSVPLRKSAYDPARRQHLSSALLGDLSGARRSDWERLLGVTEVDLFVPQRSFVFGEADARRGVAVMSLFRLRAGRGRDGGVLFERAATEAVHELGHTYGLDHCRDAGCVMWFSSDIEETDRKGRSFCGTHASSLDRTLG